MEKDWMNAPLPPLSQSIITSGLVVGDYSIARIPNPTKKKPRSSSTINMSAVKRSTPKTLSQRPGEISSRDSDLFINRETSAKTSRPKNMYSQTSQSPTRKIASKSKAPIEQYHIYSKEERDQIYHHEQPTKTIEKITMDYISNSSRLKSDRPIGLETYRINFKEETNEIITELDKNISSVCPDIENIDINALPVQKQTELKAKLLQFYNFSFNKLILQERPLCTERALLMRRIHIFYNQLFGDIPSLMNNIQIFSNEQNEKYNSLLEHTKEIETKSNNVATENKELKDQVELLQKQIESITASSNQKDIQMSTDAFDLDLAKCQAAKYQLKLKEKKERINSLEKSIQKLEEENKNQLLQIDNLTKTINGFKLDENGYLALYHKAQTKIEELKLSLKNLEDVNFNLTHIKKADIEIQTDLIDQKDSPPKNTQPSEAVKKDRKGPIAPIQLSFPLKNPKRGRRGSAVVVQRNPIDTSSEKVPQNDDNKATVNSDKSKSKKEPNSFSKTQPVSLKKKSEKTTEKVEPVDQLSSQTIDVEKEIVVPKSYVDVEVQTIIETTDEKSATTTTTPNTKSNPPSPDKTLKKEVEYTQFKTPSRYSIDHTKIDSLPDLFEIIMPFLSQPCMKSSEQELRVINNSSCSKYKSDKPIVWCLQLIHGFLTDSFIRSFKNASEVSIESIFIEWLNRRYNLSHLVQQVISDISYIIIYNRQKVPILMFFIEILIGRYSFAQLCFLSTLYTFSYEFTFPEIASLIQSAEFDGDEEPMIHIECAEKIISKCFSSEIASQFVRKEFNEVFDSKNPMISFINFLSKSTDLFGDEHQHLYTKSKDLLLLCGCYDSMAINFDCFVKFFRLIGFGSNIKIFKKNNDADFDADSQFDFKSEWKRAIKKTELSENKSDVNTLRLSGILSICAEKKKPLVKILETDSLKVPLIRVKNLSSFVLDFYYDLQSRFANLIPRIFGKLSPDILQKIEPYSEKLRKELLKADVGSIVYAYRMLVIKIDKLLMKERGFIPFNANSNSEVISKLVEYIDRTESVSFALID